VRTRKLLGLVLVLGALASIPAASSASNDPFIFGFSDIAPAALQQHVFWGSLIAGLALWGPGKWSLENWWPGSHARVGAGAGLGVRA
jgi:putative oxidoreductase